MARRQEQEPAREEVSEVAPGVLRMELPIRMPGLGHVNCYALLDDRGVALVDPGLPGPRNARALAARLGQAGLSERHVHTVIVTHSHPDHFGGAGRLARTAGARVLAHESFAFGPPGAAPPAHVEASVEDLAAQAEAEAGRKEGRDEGEEISPSAAARACPPFAAPPGRTPWGGRRQRPPWLARIGWRFLAWSEGGTIVPEVSDPVAHGQAVRLAGREWFIQHTPGHTADHVCLFDPEHGVLLAGDHVLPTITPHISGVSQDPDPLRAFVRSLDQVAAIPGAKQVLPAHGHPFRDLPGRVEAIKLHHRERLARIREIGRDLGKGTVGAFSRRLFRRAVWGTMAESETFAHLEHLRLAREAERFWDEAGRLVYRVR
jgi:glyoxylase-like metal-dependent hydrolase (beta-lactamase superfamily II)